MKLPGFPSLDLAHTVAAASRRRAVTNLSVGARPSHRYTARGSQLEGTHLVQHPGARGHLQHQQDEHRQHCARTSNAVRQSIRKGE